MEKQSSKPNIIEIGAGESFRDDWNQRATVAGADEVAAFGPDSEKLFAEYFGYVVSSRLRELTGMKSSDAVLDVGCGPGKMVYWNSPHVRSITGVDVSDVMLARAKERCAGLKNVTFHQTDGTDLSCIPSSSIDVAYSFACFIHIPEDVQRSYEKEIIRCLKPGGTGLMHVRYKQEFKRFVRTYSGASYTEDRVKEIAAIPGVKSAEMMPITRADDLVEDLNIRRWILVKKDTR